MARKKKDDIKTPINANGMYEFEMIDEEDGPYDENAVNADIEDTIYQTDGNFMEQNWLDLEDEDEPEHRKVDNIKVEDIKKATEILTKYRNQRTNLDQRIKANETWWKLRHNQYLRKENSSNVEPTSAWLFNSIMNKLADFSDHIPEANIRARMKDDQQEAKRLKNLLPMIMERCDFEQVYMDSCLSELKNGISVIGVFFDPNVDDIVLKNIDPLSIVWQPGIKDVQASKHLFTLEAIDNDTLKEMYPDIDASQFGKEINIPEYHYEDAIQTDQKSVVINWYYKKDGKVHLVKYVNDTILEATENLPDDYPNGLYDDGQYPFIFNSLFKQEGSLAGFGYIDVCKSPQEYIDKMDAAIITNTLMQANPRYFNRNDSGINTDDFLDWTKPLITTNSQLGQEDLRPIEVPTLSGNVFQAREAKVQELKQTSGNSDVSTGTASSGVTAASAISQLVETGSKGSRLAIKGKYRSYRKMIYMVIERIRQFYDTIRYIRVVGEDGEEQYSEYTNAGLVPQPIPTMSGEYNRYPQFDIEVSAQKASPYNKMQQNELALQFYQSQFFNPQNADATLACLNMMDFDHKEDIIAQVQQNQNLLMENIKLKMLCDLYVPGSNLTGAAMPSQVVNNGAPSAKEQTQRLENAGESKISDDRTNSQAQRMRRAVADSTEV